MHILKLEFTNIKIFEHTTFHRTYDSDEYNDARLDGYGTFHGYNNVLNPFLEVSLVFFFIIN